MSSVVLMKYSLLVTFGACNTNWLMSKCFVALTSTATHVEHQGESLEWQTL